MHTCRNALAALAKPAASSGGAPGCSGPLMCSDTSPVAAASPARGAQNVGLSILPAHAARMFPPAHAEPLYWSFAVFPL